MTQRVPSPAAAGEGGRRPDEGLSPARVFRCHPERRLRRRCADDEGMTQLALKRGAPSPSAAFLVRTAAAEGGGAPLAMAFISIRRKCASLEAGGGQGARDPLRSIRASP